MITKKRCVPCQGGVPPLNENEINNFIKELDVDWQVHENRELQKVYVFKTYKGAMIFVNSVAELAERNNHHPDIYINWTNVEISITSHDMGGVSTRCVNLANQIDNI